MVKHTNPAVSPSHGALSYQRDSKFTEGPHKQCSEFCDVKQLSPGKSKYLGGTDLCVLTHSTGKCFCFALQRHQKLHFAEFPNHFQGHTSNTDENDANLKPSLRVKRIKLCRAFGKKVTCTDVCVQIPWFCSFNCCVLC